MPGERCLNRNLSRFEITCLADHDSVGVLAEKCAQDAREGETDPFVHRDLNYSLQVVLDRLFRCQQLGIEGVYFAQTGIKRRGFSRAGRARGYEDSIWPVDQFEQVIVDVIRHPEHLEIEIDGCAIEHAQDYAFAELSRQGGDAKINMAARDVLLNATILG